MKECPPGSFQYLSAELVTVMTTLDAEISRLAPDKFTVLILDNEVTVGHFVTDPPFPWARLTERNGTYRVAEGYPNRLTAEQARFEMRNWDAVSSPGILRGLKELENSVDYVLIGNNAGQGLLLARGLPQSLIGSRAAIIYAEGLPQLRDYERMGYRAFFRRSQAASRLLDLAKRAGRSPALFFINTIQHNELNYHDP